jgi:predicted Fe-Mo cluster-binding NifX family protein
MRVAVPVWGSRISPVFDTARTVEIINHDGEAETGRHRIELHPGTLSDRIDQLRANGVEILLCGAISRPLLNLLLAAGVEVHPFLAGECETLLQAWRERRLEEPRFRMPGCCGGRGRHLRRNRRLHRDGEGKES